MTVMTEAVENEDDSHERQWKTKMTVMTEALENEDDSHDRRSGNEDDSHERQLKTMMTVIGATRCPKVRGSERKLGAEGSTPKVSRSRRRRRRGDGLWGSPLEVRSGIFHLKWRVWFILSGILSRDPYRI